MNARSRVILMHTKTARRQDYEPEDVDDDGGDDRMRAGGLQRLVTV